MGILRDEQGKAIGVGNPLEVNIANANVMQPVDIQARYAQTEPLHQGVSIAAGGTSNSGWIDTAGFAELGITFNITAAVGVALTANWSHDGATVHASETISASGTATTRAVTVTTKARYFRLNASNGDTSSRTANSWAYMKA